MRWWLLALGWALALFGPQVWEWLRQVTFARRFRADVRRRKAAGRHMVTPVDPVCLLCGAHEFDEPCPGERPQA